MPNSAIGNPMKYNPQLWSKDELRNIFVARQHELDDIVQRIRDAGSGQTVQHVLITGARGMGKSTLLNRVALAVHDDAELSAQWLSLRMPEEQYTVAQLNEFWLNVLDILADTLEQNQHPDQADRLDQAVAELKSLAAEAQANAARDLLLDWCRQNQKRLLLLVDGTDMLFNSLNSSTKTSSDDSQLWSLRKTLMQHPELFWVGASYQALEVHQQYSEAFHDFFEVIELRPLSLQDMRNALMALAETFGTARQAPGPEASRAMQHTLDAQPERLQSLRQISGGNPRTTVILFELFAQDSHADIYSDLKVLLDNLTPHYKARMENHLAEQPRKIMAHIMEHWRPIGLGELAEISGIASTTLSGQLKRLEQDGYIEKTKLPGTRSSGYQASERLFNIWHLMRNAPRRVRQKLSWLIEFMRLWYSNQELSGLAGQRLHAHRNGELQRDSDLEVSLAYAAALPEDSRERYQLEHSVFLTARQLAACQQQAINQIIPGLLELDGCDSHYKTAEDYEQNFQSLDALLDTCPHPRTKQEQEQWRRLVKQSVYLNLTEKQRIAEDSATLSQFKYDELLKVFKNEEDKCRNIWGQEATRLMLDAIAKGLFFPDCPDAELTYRQVLHLFEHQPKLIEWSTWLLYRKKNGNSLLEKLYRLWIETDSSNARPWDNLGNLLKNHLNRYDEAEQAYRKAIELDANFARPWNGLGNLLQAPLNRYDEAEQAYRKAIELDANYAPPWNGLGSLLQNHLNRYDEAEQAYRKAIELDANYAPPWNGLGNLLKNHLNRYDEAEQAYRKAIELDANFAYPWNGLGSLLQNHLNRYDEAEQAYRKAIELDANYAPPWNGLGNLLQDHLQRYQDAEQAYQQAEKLDSNDPYPYANHARLAVKQQSAETACTLYRKAAQLAQLQADQTGGTAYLELLLQAQLYLGNRDAASQALERLAHEAAHGDQVALFCLHEQTRELSALGLGLTLSDLIDQSRHAEFLQPLSLALRAAEQQPDALEGAAQEVKNMALEVLADITAFRNALGEIRGS
jgi:Flp pilus assembly protein TadD/energy-coupling factor transporter ATP-binding protein EcfA2